MEYSNPVISALFSVPVLTFHNFISESERIDILGNILKSPHQRHGALLGDAKSTHGNSNDRLDIDPSIISKIDQQVIAFSQLIGYGTNLSIVDIWSNIQKKGSQLIAHQHPESKVSGALYINVDSKSSNLYFHNPNPYVKYGMYEEESQFNFSLYKFTPVNGMLILFPSWLEHSSNYEKNMTDKRVVISFNA